MPGFDHFNFLAPYYERAIKFDALEIMLGTAALPAEGLLLDAGGGTGRVAIALKPYVRNVIVADLSPGMLLECLNKNLVALLAPTEALPFTPDTFSRIIMVDALHHIIDQRETVCELWRVLKPGGRLVIIEPDLRKFSVKLLALAEKLVLMRSHFLAPQEIISLFNGFDARVMLGFDGINVMILVNKP
jgi:ubiquinone/menaquinone biosynthesis C-methylase UbiE